MMHLALMPQAARFGSFCLDVSPDDPNDNLGYGYQWWVYNDGSDGGSVMYDTWDWGGQLGLVIPGLRMMAVFTGWNISDEENRDDTFQLFYNRIVVPAERLASDH